MVASKMAVVVCLAAFAFGATSLANAQASASASSAFPDIMSGTPEDIAALYVHAGVRYMCVVGKTNLYWPGVPDQVVTATHAILQRSAVHAMQFQAPKLKHTADFASRYHRVGRQHARPTGSQGHFFGTGQPRWANSAGSGELEACRNELFRLLLFLAILSSAKFAACNSSSRWESVFRFGPLA